jgi:serine/threonine-protein phosphatase 2A regulatory subunit A
MDDEEEVLLALAESLGHFIEYIGGVNHAIHLLVPLEKLCLIEDSQVRDKVRIFAELIISKATEGIKKIISMVKVKEIEPKLMEMVKRLMNGEGYTSKFAATYLIPSLYPHVSTAN